jgi:hypothetical protein
VGERNSKLHVFRLEKNAPAEGEPQENISMKHRLASLALLATSLAVSSAVLAGSAKPAQTVRPLFVTIPNNVSWHSAFQPAAGQLVQWNGSFRDHLHRHIKYTMVGGDPAATNAPTTVPVVIIPLKMVYGPLNGKMTFNPLKVKLANGQSLLANFLHSPLFRANVTYVQGGVNLGKTQYIDAFQRGNFWSSVSKNTNYHVLLGSPTVLPEQTIKVSPALGTVMDNPFGAGKVGTMEIDVFDRRLVRMMSSFAEINPGVFPLFLTYDIYLTEGTSEQVCCIGGYHSATAVQPGGQTYAYATYVDSPGAFSENVSAFSHEIGEWMDDPFTDNDVDCADNNIMEDGDPLENNANYGTFPYTVNGFTYNLQSLVFIGYFGAPRSTSVNSWLSFQNDEQSVCPGQ